MPIFVVFHRDMDGYAAASIAYEKFGKTANYIPVQYGEAIPSELNTITKEDELYILDFSYSKAICDELYLKCKRLLIIDHHETAAEELKGLDYAIFDMNHSGNVLTYKYFYPRKNLTLFHELVEDRDLWLFRYGDVTRALSLGIEATNMDKSNIHYYLAFLSTLNDRDNLKTYIEIGDILLNKQRAEVARVKADTSIYKIVKFEDTSFVFYNALNNISETAEAFYGDEILNIPCTMSFMILNDKVVFNLRSSTASKIAVNQIAKKMGGGGHYNAAGFTLPLIQGLDLIKELFTQ